MDGGLWRCTGQWSRPSPRKKMQKGKMVVCITLSSVFVAQLCLTLDCIDSSPPGSPVHRILQARILEWVVIPFSRWLHDREIESRSPALEADSLPIESPGKPEYYTLYLLSGWTSVTTHLREVQRADFHWLTDHILPLPAEIVLRTSKAMNEEKICLCSMTQPISHL